MKPSPSNSPSSPASSPASRPTVWCISPRDPLVIGTGRGFVPFVTQAPLAIPHPSTLAGAVRSAYLEPLPPEAVCGMVTHEQARRVLEQIRIKGPYLVRQEGATEEVLVPPPSDVVQLEAGKLEAGQVTSLEADEGVLWDGPELPSVVRLRALDEHDVKTARVPYGTFWPLEEAVRWALEQRVSDKSFLEPDDLPAEQRVHVVVVDDAGTASAAELFSTTGLRFPSSVSLAVEVFDESLEGDRPRRPTPGTILLGGEARISFVEERPKAAFPRFESFRATYRARLEALARASSSPSIGVRIQLLTPACLEGGWRPGWLDPTSLRGVPPAVAPYQEKVSLRLEALCLPDGYLPMSGWNLQGAGGEGAPRRVRRLVPAGTVYYFTVYLEPGLSQDGLVSSLEALSEALWWEPFSCEGGRGDEYKAAPWKDGFGLMLPGVWQNSRPAKAASMGNDSGQSNP